MIGEVSMTVIARLNGSGGFGPSEVLDEEVCNLPLYIREEIILHMCSSILYCSSSITVRLSSRPLPNARVRPDVWNTSPPTASWLSCCSVCTIGGSCRQTPEITTFSLERPT